MSPVSRFVRAALVLVSALTALGAAPAALAAPEGQMILAQTISIAPRWFDPADAEGIITPFIFYYALHDALVKPLPGNPLAPCLAESWSGERGVRQHRHPARRLRRFGRDVHLW